MRDGIAFKCRGQQDCSRDGIRNVRCCRFRGHQIKLPAHACRSSWAEIAHSPRLCERMAASGEASNATERPILVPPSRKAAAAVSQTQAGLAWLPRSYPAERLRKLSSHGQHTACSLIGNRGHLHGARRCFLYFSRSRRRTLTLVKFSQDRRSNGSWTLRIEIAGPGSSGRSLRVTSHGNRRLSKIS